MLLRTSEMLFHNVHTIACMKATKRLRVSIGCNKEADLAVMFFVCEAFCRQCQDFTAYLRRIGYSPLKVIQIPTDAFAPSQRIPEVVHR